MRNNLFKERIKKVRLDRNFSQEELAKMLGYNKSAVCDWETRGKEPSFDVLVMLCEILGVSSDYLLGLEND